MFAVSMNIVIKDFRKDLLKNGKKDSCSGSEQRIFIAFLLDEDTNGQTTQSIFDEERVGTAILS